MKVTVVKDSVIYGQKIYKVDESFEVDNDVAISLLERGYVSIEGGEDVAEELAEKGVETISVPFEKAELELLDRTELVKLAKDLGVKASGKNTEIIERILEFRAEEEIEELAHDDAVSGELPNTSMPE